MIHENIELTGSFNVNDTLVIPTHAATSSALSATGSIYNDSTENVVKLYTGTEWVVVGDQTSTPSAAIEYLTVAGGGGSGGGGSTGYHGGGGGGGGLLSGSIPGAAATYTVTVGAGGSAGAQSGDSGYSGTNGQDSSISGTSITTITSVGGGAGAGNTTSSPASRQGNDGGSGGGGALYSGVGGSGTVGQGNDGGNASANYQGAGGGGGAGTAGGNAVSSGGSGGEGTSSSITGTATYYGGGGAARGQSGNGAAVNGATAANTAGAANKGAGGGGRRSTSGMAGGSGVTIFAYDSSSSNCAGGIVGDAGNGRKYNQFYSSGTFNVGSTSDFLIPKQSDLSILWRPDDFSSRGVSTITDLSGNSRNGTVSNATLGNNPYYTFNATNAKITNSLTRPNSAQTLIMWMRFDGNGANGYNLSGWQQGGSYNYFGRLNTGNLYYYIGNGTGGDAGYSLSLNTWYMLTQTIDASGNHNLYVDTTSRVTNNSINVGSAGSLPLTVGAIGGTSNYWHNGLISTVAFYNTNFSQSDVDLFYNATKTNFI